MDADQEVVAAWEALREHWLIPTTGNKPSRYLFYNFLRMTVGPTFRFLLRMRIRGEHHIPRKGPVILAANHLSHVDPIMVILSSRRTTHYLAKDGHFEKWWTRFVMKSTGQIETQRESGGLDALSSAADVLDQGRALGIFPEGTRSKRTEAPFLLPGKTGVARLAASYPNSVVIPIALLGTRGMMEPQKHKLPRLHRPVTFQSGEGVTWYQWLTDVNGGNQSVSSLKQLAEKEEHEIRSELASLFRRFTDQLMGSIQALGAP
jgi:1-acyl-sn-glycerol-3-phosphate acyltransferase